MNPYKRIGIVLEVVILMKLIINLNNNNNINMIVMNLKYILITMHLLTIIRRIILKKIKNNNSLITNLNKILIILIKYKTFKYKN